AALALGVAAAVFALRSDPVGAMSILYYPLAVAIVLLFMPGKINADAVRTVVSLIEGALDAERVRAADSVRHRVDASPEPLPAPDRAGTEEEHADRAEEPNLPRRARMP
ncbi:MAG: hypothetical protein ACRELB_04770, partial [Polyangiaceae bacterium]